MYGIFTYIYHKNQPNVGKYTSPIYPMGLVNCQFPQMNLRARRNQVGGFRHLREVVYLPTFYGQTALILPLLGGALSLLVVDLLVQEACESVELHFPETNIFAAEKLDGEFSLWGPGRLLVLKGSKKNPSVRSMVNSERQSVGWRSFVLTEGSGELADWNQGS